MGNLIARFQDASTGELLPGGCITATSNATGQTQNVPDDGAGDQDKTGGVIEVGPLVAGNYDVAVCGVPTGFTEPENGGAQTVTVAPNGKSEAVPYVLTPRPGTMIINTTDTSGSPVGGGCFQVTGPKDAPSVDLLVCDNGDGDGDDNEGAISIAGLPNGTYTVTETRAPDGFILDETPREVVIQRGVGRQVPFPHHPVPTATPTPTETPTPTFTPTITVTPSFTPTPTNTATFTPTPTITPTVTPTPAPPDGLGEYPRTLKTQKVDIGKGSGAVVWTTTLEANLAEGSSGTFSIVPSAPSQPAAGAGTASPPAESNGAGTDANGNDGGNGGGGTGTGGSGDGGTGSGGNGNGGNGGDCGFAPTDVSFIQSGAATKDPVTVDHNSPSVEVQITADRAALEALGEGSYKCRQQIRYTPSDPNAKVDAPGAIPDGDSYLLPLDYPAKVHQPFDWTPVFLAGGGLLGLLAAFGGFYSTTPRLPNRSRLTPVGRRNVDDFLLRDTEKYNSFKGRWLGRPITLGNGSDVDLGVGVPQDAAEVRGTWFFPKKTTLKALTPGITVGGDRLEEGDKVEVSEGATVRFKAKQFTYTSDAEQ
jgi:hypothetical protein